MQPLKVAGYTRRIVFLDIDGVLVNRRSLLERSGRNAVADSACVEALNFLLKQSGAKLVISSSWRFCGLEEMKLILAHWGVVGEVLDITPDLTRKQDDSGLYIGATRCSEIQMWLDHSIPAAEFVILDDDADMAHLQHRLIKTVFEDGLTRADAEKAIRLFSQPAPLLTAVDAAPSSEKQSPPKEEETFLPEGKQ